MKYPVFDSHCDTAVEIYCANRTVLRDWQGHVTLSAMERLPRYAQFIAFWLVYKKHTKAAEA